jgi:hypothetical protein
LAARLCDDDRKHFGLSDEWIDFDLRAISVGDLEWLSERFNFDPDDWPEPFQGQLTLEQAGDPDAKPKSPRWRNHAFAWMLLRQAGVDASWDEAGAVRLYLVQFRGDGEPEGKEVAGSVRPDDSTTPPSDTSTD